MKSYKYILFMFSTMVFCTSCISTYHPPKYLKIARNHQKLGILPPVVEVTSFDKSSSERLSKKYNAEAYNYQENIYRTLNNKAGRKSINLEIIQIKNLDSTIFKKMYEEGYVDYSIVCKEFDLDAIIQSEFYVIRTKSRMGGLLLRSLQIEGGTSKEVSLRLLLYDKNEGKIYNFWNTSYQDAGYYSNTGLMIDKVIRKAINRMPYF